MENTYLVADVADAAEELQEVRLAVGQPGLLEVAAAEERLLALGAGKVLHVPDWGSDPDSLSKGVNSEKVLGKVFRRTLINSKLFSIEEVHCVTIGSFPVLAQRRDDALLNGPPTRAADRDAHLVVAPQAEELVLRHRNRLKWKLTPNLFICELR